MMGSRSVVVVTLCLFLLLGCSKAELLNLTIPSQSYTLVADIPYGQEPAQRLDVYIPTKSAPGNPVIVFFYGGSWQMGSKGDYRFVGEAFASKGYVAVIADYRLYPEVSFPVFLQDSATAFVWTHDHVARYGGDPDHIFLAGHSAGAYNAVMLTVDDHYVKAAGGSMTWIQGTIGLSGPYDFLPFTDPKIIALFSTADDELTQPITFVKAGLPPMLLLHGDRDQEVYLRNSLHMADKLRSFGDPVTLKIFSGFDHIDMVLALAHGFRDKGPVLDDIDQFIRETAH